MTDCPGSPGVFTPPMNPIDEGVRTFVKTLWTEVNAQFPDAFAHVGGDEVAGECWGANKTITDYMAAHNISAGDYGALQAEFEADVMSGIKSDGKRSIIWQENFAGDDGYPADAVVEVWKGDSADATAVLRNVTAAGYDALYTRGAARLSP